MINFKRTITSLIAALTLIIVVPGVANAATGWSEDEEGNKYYYVSETKTVKSKWKQIDGYWYYFDEEGKMAKGITEIEGILYRFKSTGKLAKGWYTKDDKTYYFTYDGAYKGWHTIDGKKYYFNKKTCVMTVGFKTLKDKLYYFNSKGVMKKGWFEDSAGDKYYFETDGHAIRYDWKKLDGYWYFFDEECKMAKGIRSIDGELYRFKSTGKLAKGWYTKDDRTYYFTYDGAYKGWKTIDKKKYYFNKKTCVMTVGYKTLGEKSYIFDTDGVLQKSGWIKYNKNYYYADSAGVLLKGDWLQIGKDYYYLDSDGIMLTGLQKIKKATYYFYPLGKNAGKMAKNTTINGRHFNSKGKMDYIVSDEISWHAKEYGSYALGTKEADDNATLICSMLMVEYGWSFEACCGLLGNIAREGGLNPWQWEIKYTNQLGRIPTVSEAKKTGYGYGLIGWTPARKYCFDNAKASNGVVYFPNYNQSSYDGYGPNFSDKPGNIEDGKAQTKLIGEAMSKGSGNIWIKRKDVKATEYIKLTSVEKAAYYWLYNAEYPLSVHPGYDAAPTEKKRKESAIEWYNRLGGKDFTPVYPSDKPVEPDPEPDTGEVVVS